MLRPALVVVLGLAALKPSLCSKVASEAGSHVDDVPAPKPKPKLDDANAKPKPDEPAGVKADDEGGDAPLMEAAQVVGGDDETETCVKDCVQRNPMRAVSAEQIEQDCRTQCSAK
jgi:hypothetical protein